MKDHRIDAIGLIVVKHFVKLGMLISITMAAILGCGQDQSFQTSASSVDARISQLDNRILALGDSLAFGWDPFIEKDLTKVKADNYQGYAEIVGEALGVAVDNGSCPGETSASFLSPSAEDNGCKSDRTKYKLHIDWDSSYATQYEFMTDYLKKAVATGKAPKFVTLNIGANDLLLVQDHCQLPGFLTAVCEVTKLPFAQRAFGKNLEQILMGMHQAGYRGTVVLLTTYAPNYKDTIATMALGLFNDEMHRRAKKLQSKLAGMSLVVADGYAAFEKIAKSHDGSTCEAGLLIKKQDGSCDLHVGRQGHEVLAQAILDVL